MNITNFLVKLFGDKKSRDLKAYRPLVQAVLDAYPSVQTLSNDELRDYRIWCQRNRYWRSRLRSMTMTFTGVNVVDGYLGVGVVCRYMDGSERGVPMLCTRYYRDFTNTVSGIRIDCVPLFVLGGE